MIINIFFTLLAYLFFPTQTANASQWQSRTIYQLLTDRFAKGNGNTDPCNDLGKYCGGDYKGIINHLDYIQGMGFDAIWISPIVDNYDGNYHGYAGRNLWALNSNFGTQQDFINFIDACHSRNIWVMVDVVGNHMGNLDLDFSHNVNLTNPQYYHDYCMITDEDFNTYNQYRIQNCRLANLADLKQQNDYVRVTLLNWIRDLVIKYKIDGLRVDTIPEVPKWFWSQFAASAGVFTIGQVFNGNMNYVAGYVGTVDTTLNYPFYFWVKDTFFNYKDMINLRSFYNQWAKNIDLVKLRQMGNFLDNHDNARTMGMNGDWQSKKKLYKSGQVMTLTSVGIPIVYYGAQQYFAGGNDPNNRQILWRNMDTNSEMYKYLNVVIAARKKYEIWKYDQIQRYADNQIFAYTRGKFLVILTNKVSYGVSKFISYHPFSNGETICNIFFPTTDCIVVNGGFQIYLLNGEAKIYVPK